MRKIKNRTKQNKNYKKPIKNQEKNLAKKLWKLKNMQDNPDILHHAELLIA